jgi:hypothetical protein
MSNDNFFEIDSPQIYRCNVFRYHSGLSRLYIRVFKGMSTAPSFYLLFSDVGYFEGPMNWQGVAFQRDTPEACLDFMARVGMVADLMLDDPDTRAALSEAAHLYTMQTPQNVIHIIAGDAVRLPEIPEALQVDGR